MSTALLIDFGSTYTKLRAVDLAAARVLATGQGPSTVTSDVTIGMSAALSDLEQKLGTLPQFKYRLASSSAAGGLKMITIGLVKELTAEAARQAALGAGAKLIGTFANHLTGADLKQIEALSPDMILLAGGTDGGNAEVILANAARLAASPIMCPIVLAGNRSASDEAAECMLSSGKLVSVSENVMPNFGELNIEPARAAIRQIFIDRIVHAKGIDRAAASFDRVLMPTPAAVMEGARLMSAGTETQQGLGELLVVDIGGATTDVHSVAKGDPTTSGAIQTGLPEPYVKRTVEGDLGMRHNAAAIVDAVGREAMARKAKMSVGELDAVLEMIAEDAGRLPATASEVALDEALAYAAIELAVSRHCGTIRIAQTVTGPVAVQTGKDLTNVRMIIGTGGILAHGAAPARILAAALGSANEPMSLKPRTAALALDRDYLLYATGLLAEVEPEAAYALAAASLERVSLDKESSHGRDRSGL